MFKQSIKHAVRFGIGFIFMSIMVSVCYGLHCDITNVNIDNYPGNHLFVRVTDDDGNYVQDLGPGNFELREDGELCPVGVLAHNGNMAVTLVMDQSGSMTGYGPTVISACSYFVNGFEDLDKGAIVKFSNSAYTDVHMTYNHSTLLTSIGTYSTNGNTALWNAINLGIQECALEPEKKAIVAFTDGQDNMSTIPYSQLPSLAGPDITIYTIGIGSNLNTQQLTYVAEGTGGFYLHITDPSQMQAVLTDIREDVDNLYDLGFSTPDPDYNGTHRILGLTAFWDGQTAFDTASYNAPFSPPPVVTLDNSTLQYLGVSQPGGVSLHISCQINSSNTIADARIYYKTTGDVYYQQENLVHGSGHTYYYNIPSSAIETPALEFYLQTTDNIGSTITAPSFDPAILPLSIPVLPNYAPSITYDPPDLWLVHKSLPIEIQVSDTNGVVDSVLLYYRDPRVLFYTEKPMTHTSGTNYSCVLDGPLLDDHGNLEMFFVARDNQNVAGFWHWADDPYFLDVVMELAPTPPAVALETQQLPIVIPAGGGSFNYILNVINPIPSADTCDTWADLVFPDSTIQVTSPVLLDIALPGGQSYVQSYVQEVPNTAVPGQYYLRLHTGDHSTGEIYFTASIPFTKSTATGPGFFDHGWRCYLLEQQPPEMDNPLVQFSDGRPYLSSGFPNPFNLSTSLEYYVPSAGHISIMVYDINGREIARLANGLRQPGTYRVFWDAAQFSSGVYFCSLTCGSATVTTRLTLVK